MHEHVMNNKKKKRVNHLNLLKNKNHVHEKKITSKQQPKKKTQKKAKK